MLFVHVYVYDLSYDSNREWLFCSHSFHLCISDGVGFPHTQSPLSCPQRLGCDGSLFVHIQHCSILAYHVVELFPRSDPGWIGGSKGTCLLQRPIILRFP
jgi:hypothetical protein